MAATLDLTATTGRREILLWLHSITEVFGVLRVPDERCPSRVDEYVVMRPEHLSELETIVNDPAFLAALEAGVADATDGRVRRLAAGASLSSLIDDAPPCDPTMTRAIERGIDDAAAGRVRTLDEGQSLRDLL